VTPAIAEFRHITNRLSGVPAVTDRILTITDNSDRLVGNINEKDGESNLFGVAIVQKLKNHNARLYGRVSIGKEKGPMAKNP
jgi:hypothetical protein